MKEEHRTESEEQLQTALKLSEAEERQARERAREEDEAELQKALRASAAEKGKGRAPQRQDSMDDEELQTALALSASDIDSGQAKGSSSTAWRDDDPDFDEEAQKREWARAEQHRQSMFDRAETSSLSIISERTEGGDGDSVRTTLSPVATPMQPLAGGSQTPLLSQGGTSELTEEPPSYFGLWMGNSKTSYLDEKDRMTVLPPLSELVAAAQGPPKPPTLPKRPLPNVPPVPPRPAPLNTNVSFGTDFDPNDDNDSIVSARTPGVTSPTSYFTAADTPAASNSSASNSDESHSRRPVPPTPANTINTPSGGAQRSSYHDSMYSSNGATEDGSDRTPIATPLAEQPPHTHMAASNRDNSGSDHQHSASGHAQQSSGESEVVWPEDQGRKRTLSGLPPGARLHQTTAPEVTTPTVLQPEDEEDIFNANPIRYGFIQPSDPALPITRRREPFPDVIQLSNVMNEDGKPYGCFACEAATWSSLLRFLNWHGDTRLEAHPLDIQNEKAGCGGKPTFASAG